jgi:ferric-dicitrate binding protein FerR (iron transport regulator)
MAPVTKPHDSEGSRMHDPAMTEGDQIGQLLKLAGRRQMPDPTDMRHARDAARAEWTLVVRRRTWRGRWRMGIGALAAALCALAAWISFRTPATLAPLPEVAIFQRIAGTVVMTGAGLGRQTVSGSGVPITQGARIEIGDTGGAALVLTGGAIVRLDRATAVGVEDASHLTLERGAAYVDSGRAPGSASPLRIETPFGTVRHVGTRFEVRLAGASMRVRVRDGLVAVERDGTGWQTGAGEALVLTSAGAPGRQRIATSGPEWSWVDRLSAPFVLEGATVTAFLDWVSREEGSTWEIADAPLRARANRIVLHGSIDGLTPEEALAAVLPASGLTHRRDGARLLISAEHSAKPRQ